MRATIVKVTDGGARRIFTGPRLRSIHLIAFDSTSTRRCYCGVKDALGTWSEWSPYIDLAASNYSAGATSVSIGSASVTDVQLTEPAVTFPTFSAGSAKLSVHRTLVGGGFPGEQRRRKWPAPLAAFKMILKNLGEEEWRLLHRWYQALNGPMKPFYFDFTDPNTDVEKRYIVRFRDPTLTDSLFDTDMVDMALNLIEVPMISFGGDI